MRDDYSCAVAVPQNLVQRGEGLLLEVLTKAVLEVTEVTSEVLALDWSRYRKTGPEARSLEWNARLSQV